MKGHGAGGGGGGGGGGSGGGGSSGSSICQTSGARPGAAWAVLAASVIPVRLKPTATSTVVAHPAIIRFINLDCAPCRPACTGVMHTKQRMHGVAVVLASSVPAFVWYWTCARAVVLCALAALPRGFDRGRLLSALADDTRQ